MGQERRMFLNKDNGLDKGGEIRISSGFMPLYNYSASSEQAEHWLL